MKLTGKQLSLQACRMLNDEVLEWISRNTDEISESCLISEFFTSKIPAVVALRGLLRDRLNDLRTVGKEQPGQCIIRHIRDPECEGPEWKRLSSTMLGAALTMDHSNFVGKKGQVKRKKVQT